ncbi:SusD/RagB family nutrient-binding outer membrane lipoprotein [Niabella beijingensis]|uniref:SusD/RagB family nutrient-binding outer membrane lipoprotein n=1 Tax=Niabella beijingensis TaxID=2872700 RepID=UPI001CBCCEE2|nr:SusD/RagB family nutrient-binding outer membrane lipoprotein [Niabella beijingensis]MBZ4190683.1 SusD/RagB family nutrient-binding outer membrane lipoprotein [Niabella beijingensis]
MKKIFNILLIVTVILSSCTKDITKLNVDPKNPQEVSAVSLFTTGQRFLARYLASSNVNVGINRLIVQQWQETTYTAESRYNLNTRDIPGNFWSGIYEDVLGDIERSKKLIPTDTPDPDVQKNQLAVADIHVVLAYYYLITTFGNVPYTDAGNIENIHPKYDDGKTVYADLISRLDAAINAINTSAEGFGSADAIYDGDMTAWKKFGNTLKLKLGMLLADSDPAQAKTLVEAAVSGGVFTSNDDNAKLQFSATPPNTNPVWEDLVQSGRQDFVACQTIIDTLKKFQDPRLSTYFTLDGTGSDYSGGEAGRASSYPALSKPAKAITAANYPTALIDYAEVEFMLAEARERGYNVGGTAMTHYSKAITASIEDWGGTPAEAATYLARPNINYLTAPGNYKRKIGVQKWLALYNRPFEAWIEWRIFDYPELKPAYRALSDIPIRYTYPVLEQNYNTENYNAAAAAIGGDEVTTKLFWDKQ